MGSRISRRIRRNMSGNDEDDGNEQRPQQAFGEDLGDDEPMDLATVLRYLIQSGQVRVIRGRDMGIGRLLDMSDDDDDEEDDEDFVPAAGDPNVQIDPDTKTIDDHDIRQQVLLHAGQHCKHRCSRSFPGILYQRELGMGRYNQLTAGDRSHISHTFLPNHMTKLAAYHHKAFCGEYAQDGNIFLTACQDQHIRIYKTENDNFEEIKKVTARDVGWSVVDTAFSPDGNFLIYSSWSEFIHMCNIHGALDTHVALDLRPTERRFCVFSLQFSTDNSEILAGANDGCVYIYDRERNERTLKVDSHDDDVNSIAFADFTSQILYSGGDDGLIKVWDRRTLSENDPHPVGILAGHADGITFIDSKGDARYLISNCKDQTIKLWDVRRFASEDAQTATKKAVSKQTWDYRWQSVPRRMLRNTSISGDTSLMTYRGHCVLHTLIRSYFSPMHTTGQRYIITGCATGSFLIYDLLTGKIVSKQKQHRSCVRDVSWHPYENNIITSSWDGVIGRWEYHSPEASSEGKDEAKMECDEGFFPLRRSLRLRQQRERDC